MADLTTITNEPIPAPARLPALGAPELSVEYLAKMKEIIEVMLGRRGSQWDRAVTFRDMQDGGGLGGSFPGATGGAATFNPATGQVVTSGGASFSIDAALRESEAYKDLMARIGSVEELADFPSEIRAQLETAIAEVARERRAAINSIETKVQNEQMSVAWRLDEITASLNNAAAGVREYSATYADSLRAVATRVEQVAAELEEIGGVEVQEQLTAISDAVDGLMGQWSLKIQSNPAAGQPPVIAGIALSVEDPIAGPGTSSLIFMSEKVGFYTQNGTLNPFSISGNQVMMSDVIMRRARVIMDNGTVVLDAGRTLAQQTSSNPNRVPRPWSWPASRRAGNAFVVTNTADTRSRNGEYLILPPGTGYIAHESDPLNIPSGDFFTVSFDVHADTSANRYINVDMFATGVDTPGIIALATTAGGHYSFTEKIDHANAPLARLRVWNSGNGSQAAIYNIKVELGKVETGWSDNVITLGNISEFMQPAVVSTTYITDLAVTNAKIADLAVTNAKISNLAVTNAKIEDLAVTNAKIADLAVSTLKIGANAVTVPISAAADDLVYGIDATTWLTALQTTFNMPQDGYLYAHALLAQSYGSTVKTWNAEMLIDGISVWYCGGDSVETTPGLAGIKYVSAGQHSILVRWRAVNDSIRIAQRRLYCQLVMR